MSAIAQYSLILVSYLAEHFDEEYVSLKKIAENYRLSFPFLKQIALNLKQKGILESKEGIKGGYRLSKSPEDITLDTLISSFEDTSLPNFCCQENSDCVMHSFCLLKNAWHETQRQVLKELAKKKLSHYVRLMQTSRDKSKYVRGI